MGLIVYSFEELSEHSLVYKIDKMHEGSTLRVVFVTSYIGNGAQGADSRRFMQLLRAAGFDRFMGEPLRIAYLLTQAEIARFVEALDAWIVIVKLGD